MLGIIMQDEEQTGKKYKYVWAAFILSPLILPIFIGIKLEEKFK